MTYGVHLFRVAQHHMREGQLLTQTQEEMLLIGGFGLFWLGTSGPVPVLCSRALLSSPSPPCLISNGSAHSHSGPWRLVLDQISIVLIHATRVIKCVPLFRVKPTPTISYSTSPSPSYPFTCGPVIVKRRRLTLEGSDVLSKRPTRTSSSVDRIPRIQEQGARPYRCGSSAHRRRPWSRSGKWYSREER